MLDLVPFAGARRKVADGKRQPGLIRKSLQLQFPQSQPGTIAATAVGGDENLLRSGIQMPALQSATNREWTPPRRLPCHGRCQRSQSRHCAPGHKFLNTGVDMAELRIPVGVVAAFLRLAIALQAVVLLVEQLGHLHVADRMLLRA
jgi:hypothetical protein